MKIGDAANWLGRRLTPARLLVVGAVAIAFLFVGIFLSVRPPQTITVVDARADKVTFQVSNAAMAAMRLTCMELTSVDSTAAPEPVDGLFTPADGFDVTYRVVNVESAVKVGSEQNVRAVSIVVEPSRRAAGETGYAGQSAVPHGDQTDRSNTIRLTTAGAARQLSDRLIIAPRSACATERPQRFPVWGAIDIGDELGAASDEGEPLAHLRGGTVNVYARARTLSQVFEWLFNFQPTLYRVADDFPLPFGARVSGGGRRPFSPWQGIAMLNADGELEVKVTGRGEDVELFLPGAMAPEKIVSGGLAQFLADPNVLALQIYAAATTFVIAVIALILQIVARHPEPWLAGGEQQRAAGPAHQVPREMAIPAEVDTPTEGGTAKPECTPQAETQRLT